MPRPASKKTGETKPAKVYEYGARLSREAQEVAFDILRKAHAYRNKLVELDLLRRSLWYKTLGEYDDRLPGLFKERDELYEEKARTEKAIRKIRAIRRSKLMEEGDLRPLKHIRAEIKALSAIINPLVDAVKAIPGFEERKIQLGVEAAKRKAVERAAFLANGLYGGSASLVEDACKTFGADEPPRFARYEPGYGRIGTQVRSTAKASSYIQIDPPNGKRCPARIRILSDKRDPVWLEFEVNMHRPLPEDGIITYVWLKPKVVGNRTNWYLQLTVSKPVWEQKWLGEHVLAVMPGWTSVAGGVQAARCVGTDGSYFTIDIPNDRINKMIAGEDLQHFMDSKFNEVRDSLLEFLKDKNNESIIPEWLWLCSEHLGKWRSHHRLRELTIKWRDNRFEGDETIYNECETWRKWSRQRYHQKASEEENRANWRKNFYRELACELAEDYGTLVFPDINWAKLMKKEEDLEYEESKSKKVYMTKEGNRNRKAAAPGTLVTILSQRIPAVKVDAKGVDEYCGACLEPWDTHTCGITDKRTSKCFHLIRRYYGEDEEAVARFFRAEAITELIRLGSTNLEEMIHA